MSGLDFITTPPSLFAQFVDELRGKSEAELKSLYLRMFKDTLENEWKQITENSRFEGVSDEEIVKVIQQNRYND